MLNGVYSPIFIYSINKGSMDKFAINLFDTCLKGKQYSYDLDDEFFRSIEGLIERGNVHSTVTCKKAGNRLFEFEVQSVGVVIVPCDRCLSDLELRIDVTESLTVQLGAEDDDDGDVITVCEDNGIWDVAIPLYELIVLSLPLRRVHEPGMCDEAMIKTVESYQTARSGDIEQQTEDINGVKPGYEGLARLKEILENNKLKN